MAGQQPSTHTALPFLRPRAGLAVTEYALDGKSADEIRGLWQWVQSRLAVTTATAALPEMYSTATPANAQTELSVAG